MPHIYVLTVYVGQIMLRPCAQVKPNCNKTSIQKEKYRKKTVANSTAIDRIRILATDQAKFYQSKL